MVSNIVCTHFPPLSNLIDCARSLNDGRVSGCSAQHCFIELIYSGGAVCFDTEGLSKGGGFLIFEMISIRKQYKINRNDAMKYSVQTLWC